MKCISKNIINEIVISNSRFICLLYKIYNVSDIDKYLENAKKEYPKATHYTYAYIIDDIEKSSDDGEPGSTAGMPMLSILKGNDLGFILAITIRYFGGIKLGTGGLVRAYSNSVREALKKIKLHELIDAKEINLETYYEHIKEIDYLLKDEKIINKEFTDKVIYNVIIRNKSLEKFKNYNIKIIKDTYIEKIEN